MAGSDFLGVNLAALCDALASEVTKTYKNLPWALKNEAVSRLKRQIHALSQEVLKAKEARGPVPTQNHLKEAVALTHECVPLMGLALRKNMLSSELHERWVKRLGEIEVRLEEWLRGT